jgi:hypothetical protein
MSLTKVSLGGNHGIIPAQGDIHIPAGDGNIEKIFLRCSLPNTGARLGDGLGLVDVGGEVGGGGEVGLGRHHLEPVGSRRATHRRGANSRRR